MVYTLFLEVSFLVFINDKFKYSCFIFSYKNRHSRRLRLYWHLVYRSKWYNCWIFHSSLSVLTDQRHRKEKIVNGLMFLFCNFIHVTDIISGFFIPKNPTIVQNLPVTVQIVQSVENIFCVLKYGSILIGGIVIIEYSDLKVASIIGEELDMLFLIVIIVTF